MSAILACGMAASGVHGPTKRFILAWALDRFVKHGWSVAHLGAAQLGGLLRGPIKCSQISTAMHIKASAVGLIHGYLYGPYRRD